MPKFFKISLSILFISILVVLLTLYFNAKKLAEDKDLHSTLVKHENTDFNSKDLKFYSLGTRKIPCSADLDCKQKNLPNTTTNDSTNDQAPPNQVDQKEDGSQSSNPKDNELHDMLNSLDDMQKKISSTGG